MRKPLLLVLALVGIAGQAVADPPPAAPAEQAAPADPAAKAPGAPGNEVKQMSGMSVLGNQEAPTSLVIVPWKSSEMGSGIGVSKGLDTKIGPVDRDVFMRELRYYKIRSAGEK
jgi:hypothetical protein